MELFVLPPKELKKNQCSSQLTGGTVGVSRVRPNPRAGRPNPKTAPQCHSPTTNFESYAAERALQFSLWAAKGGVHGPPALVALRVGASCATRYV